MNTLRISIIYCSAIYSVLNEWSEIESTQEVKDIRKRIESFMSKQFESNHSEFVEAVENGNKAWQATIDQFKDRHLKIEAASTVVALWSGQADNLARFANLTQKRVDRFALMNDGTHDVAVEMNAYLVADALIFNIEKEIG